MGLTDRLRAAAAARPHLLLVGTPGGTAARLAVERAARLRGWPLADSPADADVLLTVGPAGPVTGEAADRLYAAMPVPRVRAEVPEPASVDRVLDGLGRDLRSAAALRPAPSVAVEPGADHEGHQGHQGHQGHGGGGHEGHGGGGHEGHGGGGHEGHGGTVAGLAMAERGPDRDGLRLDRLHVALGPVLSWWPAGLVVHATLQGDVLQEVHVQAVDVGGPAYWDQPWRHAAQGHPVGQAAAARRAAAAYADSLRRLLALAGAPRDAYAAARLRDDLLAGAPAGPLAAAGARLVTRWRRARLLPALTAGLGVLDVAAAERLGVAGPARAAAGAGGDVSARWAAWVTALAGALAQLEAPGDLDPATLPPPRGPLDGAPPSAALLAALGELLVGTELAGARLVVASLDPDLAQLAGAASPAGHHAGGGHA